MTQSYNFFTKQTKERQVFLKIIGTFVLKFGVVVQQARAVSRKRGRMPAETFVRICKFTARPSLCETPALAKPPPRYLSFWDSA
jgi:hypothetical protein